jgi:predicted RND superfamily exporter protein
MDRFVLAWGHWVTRYRVATITLSLLLALAAASGGQFLTFTNDYRVFFGSEDTHLQAFEELQDTFSKNDNALIVLAPRDGKVFTPDTLAAVADATERAWLTPFSIRVDSLTNFQHTTALGDDLEVAPLVENPQNLTDDDLARIKTAALAEPALISRLISPDARITAINITVELPGVDEATENPRVAAAARDLRDYVEATYPDIDVYLTGIVMMNQAFQEAAMSDTTQLIPAALAIILLMVFLQLRGLTGTLGTLIVIVLSVIAAMGAAGWAGIRLTPPSMSAPTIILTLAVADCVHILSNWLQKIREGLGKQ